MAMPIMGRVLTTKMAAKPSKSSDSLGNWTIIVINAVDLGAMATIMVYSTCINFVAIRIMVHIRPLAPYTAPTDQIISLWDNFRSSKVAVNSVFHLIKDLLVVEFG